MKVLDLSYHPLDVRSGRWLDLSRKGNHGTPHGGARPYMIAPGVMGFKFDGSSGYVAVPSTDFPTSGTVGMWLKPYIKSGTNAVFGIRGVSAYNHSRILFYFTSNSDVLRFRMENTDGTLVYFASQQVTMGKWMCVTLTFGSAGISSYVDSEVVLSETSQWVVSENFLPDFYIGAGEGGGGTLNGFVAGVYVYGGEILNQAEIRENMYRSPIYRMLRGLPHSMIYTKVPWKQTQGGIYVP